MALETSSPVPKAVGTYELLEKIAEGGMGSIYKGRHRETGLTVAIKVMPAHMTGNTILLRRFEQEFRAASRLDHPNIVRALDYGEHENTPYLVMEFVDGESLGRKIERDGPLAEPDAIRLIAQVAQGLHRAHKQGLIHRDVKPDNILLTAEGQAKLADLGLVKEVDADLNLTRTGRGLGTPHFMAPEQFRNAKNADVLCDIYSLGATLYVMLTGELPFRANGPLDAWMKKIHNDMVPPRRLAPHLTERVDWAIRRAMSADPDQRPTTCREFVEDLTGRSTRKVGEPDPAAANQDTWYLIYKDDNGEPHTVKGTTPAIRRALKEGLLGDASNVRAGRNKSGPFESVRSFPEFRDLLVTPAPVDISKVKPPAAATPTRPASSAETKPVVPAHTPRTPSPVEEGPEAPSIELEAAGPRRGDWAKWVLLLLVAAATAVAGYFLFGQGK